MDTIIIYAFRFTIVAALFAAIWLSVKGENMIGACIYAVVCVAFLQALPPRR